jgi:hypothetical protein
MTDTPHLALPLIAAAQAQKHVTHNEALRSLDALVMLSVDDRDLTAPPGSPAEGARYLVKATGTGAFAGKDGKIAHFRDGVFAFHTPRKGWIAYVADEDTLIVFDGSAWRPLLDTVAEFQNVALFGLATIADATNPLSARLNNALFAARTVAAGGDGDLRWKLSKESAGDTASLLFQDNFSGRAEIGLAGDDDLHIKVSADGTTWTEALRIARASGRVSFPAQGMREVLTANRTYYVRTDGSNSNDGLSNSSGGAFLTLQKAWDTILTLDLHGFTVTIQIGTGTFTGGVVASIAPLGGSVNIAGNGSANTILSTTSVNCIDIACPALVTVAAMKLQTATFGDCIISRNGARVTLGADLNFGACAGVHLRSQYFGYLFAGSNYTISGSAGYHLTAYTKGIIEMSGITVTLSGTPAWSGAFAAFLSDSAISLFSVTYGGSATGKRYDGNLGSFLQSFGSGTSSSYFPGNVNGTASTGAQQT